ncbi:hypothetical protein [uncultured Flavonifractor sp.]|uniref:hypothetical protein n=1 Tax=uncultured Flavonifractor sp. TaxID=1193534 RepID=UPI0026090D5B|nr:hypothetical protein [uncultured Flavonifractor sp.]
METEARGRSLLLSAGLLPAPLSTSPSHSRSYRPHWSHRCCRSDWSHRSHRTRRHGSRRTHRTHRCAGSHRTCRTCRTRHPRPHRPSGSDWSHRTNRPPGYPRSGRRHRGALHRKGNAL